MIDHRKDEIAREAARLIESGRAGSIGDALRIAADNLGLPHTELPGRGRVRRHAQAMALEALGDAGYADRVRDIWITAERLMTVLAEGLADSRTLLVGRAAKGHIDAGVTVHIRLYTTASVTDIASTLVAFGYDEPGFATVKTSFGPLNRLLIDDDGVECVITRCMPALLPSAGTDCRAANKPRRLGQG